jgi:uncharacterized membrane protein
VLLYLHAAFMIFGFALFMTGIGIARFMRKRSWWLRSHRAFGLCGVCSIVLGFATAICMVDQLGDEHFSVLHAYIGAIVVFASLATAVLGQLQFTWKNRRVAVRSAHRWAGAMTFILLSLNILAGLVLAGVLPDMRSF